MAATVTVISPQGTYYANECIKVTIESPANTGTIENTTVYRLRFLRQDGATFESEEQIITGGQTVKLNLNEWAKDLLYHTVPSGNVTNNQTAFGFIGLETKVNEYDTSDCTLVEGSYTRDIDENSREFVLLSAYLQPDRAGTLISSDNADFDTFRDVYVCRSGFTYLNVFRTTAATITGTAILENGTSVAANITGVADWKVYRIQRGINGVPATAVNVTYTLSGSRLFTVHFCDCRCKATDTRILFLEKMGAWTVMDFDEVATIRAGQNAALLRIDNDCRNLQYGGNTYGFQDASVTKLYRSKIGVKRENQRGLTMIATAAKVMQLDGANWIKLEYRPSEAQIFEADEMLTLEISAGYSIEGQRVER